MPKMTTGWTAGEIENLESWWAEGVRTEEIRVRLGRTRFSVVAKVKARGMPRRLNPASGRWGYK